MPIVSPYVVAPCRRTRYAVFEEKACTKKIIVITLLLLCIGFIDLDGSLFVEMGVSRFLQNKRFSCNGWFVVTLPGKKP